ncbi:hypothetical protein KSP40_PGU004337 [Platanthera guangdongensis]|uniref:Uncharacterized protein n=1 Tax=Platanthera guangdongensis TaxID=2320717 RepID=A0ABR2MXU0_9ASPA
MCLGASAVEALANGKLSEGKAGDEVRLLGVGRRSGVMMELAEWEPLGSGVVVPMGEQLLEGDLGPLSEIDDLTTTFSKEVALEHFFTASETHYCMSVLQFLTFTAISASVLSIQPYQFVFFASVVWAGRFLGTNVLGMHHVQSEIALSNIWKLYALYNMKKISLG